MKFQQPVYIIYMYKVLNPAGLILRDEEAKCLRIVKT